MKTSKDDLLKIHLHQDDIAYVLEIQNINRTNQYVTALAVSIALLTLSLGDFEKEDQ